MSTSKKFNPDRLDLARRRRAMTKRALAEAAGISLRSLVGYSASEREPNSATVVEFSDTLRFPPEFFYGDTLEEPPIRGASFRALSTVTARLRDQAIAASTLGLGLSDWIDERFSLPAPNIPQYEHVDPEAAAMAIRSKWGLGERPIRNMIHLLELHGVRVYSLGLDAAAIDAFSFWRSGFPYIFLNTAKSAERSRMDAAHELGHLVLHRQSGSQRNRRAELEAQQFGSAFLMPRGSVLARAPRGASLRRIIEAKQFWNVSVANLTYRMHKLGLLSDFQYRVLFTEIGRQSFRVNEPEPAKRETSQVLDKVFQALRADGTTVSHVAKMLSIYPDELSALFIELVRKPLAFA